MYRRLTTVCHLWPSISPWNVWELTVEVWLMFAEAADDYNEKMREANRG